MRLFARAEVQFAQTKCALVSTLACASLCSTESATASDVLVEVSKSGRIAECTR
jgi:hypothetical protein